MATRENRDPRCPLCRETFEEHHLYKSTLSASDWALDLPADHPEFVEYRNHRLRIAINEQQIPRSETIKAICQQIVENPDQLTYWVYTNDMGPGYFRFPQCCEKTIELSYLHELESCQVLICGNFYPVDFRTMTLDTDMVTYDFEPVSIRRITAETRADYEIIGISDILFKGFDRF